MTLEPGLAAEETVAVTEAMTAEAVGSGDVPLLATPAVAALVERAAVAALSGALEPGQTSVGSRLELDHLAPTPVGAEVTARVRLEEVDGRRLRFSFEVADPTGTVARGTHARVIVDRARFEQSARDRAG